MHRFSCPFEFRVELALPFQISLVTAVILGIGGVDIGRVVAAVVLCSFWSGSIGLEPPHFPTEISNTSKVKTFKDDRDGDDFIAIVKKIKGPKTPKCNSSTDHPTEISYISKMETAQIDCVMMVQVLSL